MDISWIIGRNKAAAETYNNSPCILKLDSGQSIVDTPITDIPNIVPVPVEESKQNFEASRSSSKPKLELILWENQIIKVNSISTLVWARHQNFKGANYFFARICTSNEYLYDSNFSLSSADIATRLPVPEDCFLIEYFSLPTKFPKMLIVSKKKVKPFNSVHRKYKNKYISIGKKLEWGESYEIEMLNALKHRYTNSQAQYIFNSASKVAYEFLRLSLEGLSGFEQQALKNEIYINSSDSEDDIDEAKNHNITEFINVHNKDKEDIRAGDWIEYSDQIFPDIIKHARILTVTIPHKDTDVPLELSSGDMLPAWRPVKRMDADSVTGQWIPHTGGYRPLKGYEFIQGKYQGKNLHTEMLDLSKESELQFIAETGIQINYNKSTKKEFPLKIISKSQTSTNSNSNHKTPSKKTPKKIQNSNEKKPPQSEKKRSREKNEATSTSSTKSLLLSSSSSSKVKIQQDNKPTTKKEVIVIDNSPPMKKEKKK